jgi:hypothetical protein
VVQVITCQKWTSADEELQVESDDGVEAELEGDTGVPEGSMKKGAVGAVLDVQEDESAHESASGTETGGTAEIIREASESDTGGPQEMPVRRSARIASGTKPPVHYVQATFVGKDRWQEPAAETVIKAEVKQLFEELCALRPVHRSEIVAGACILTCHLFLVEKFLADGSFDKMKARLVSHGNYQNKNDFPDRSSPTVAIYSVLMVLVVYAGRLDYFEICKIDVKGAFVQTPMEGELIYMKIGKSLASRIIELYPEYSRFVDDKGNLYTEMLKAMYGCVQASLLWHRLLVKVLKELGFEQCEVDPGVM